MSEILWPIAFTPKVADLSHHFAMDHAQKSASNLNNNNNNYSDSKPVANNSVFLKIVEQPNVIPVFLPVQPLPEEHIRYYPKVPGAARETK